MNVNTARCGCGAIVSVGLRTRGVQCEACMGRERERVVAKAGPPGFLRRGSGQMGHDEHAERQRLGKSTDWAGLYAAGQKAAQEQLIGEVRVNARWYGHKGAGTVQSAAAAFQGAVRGRLTAAERDAVADQRDSQSAALALREVERAYEREYERRCSWARSLELEASVDKLGRDDVHTATWIDPGPRD